ncbi:MAG: PadR family transcriptional regulator [Candidatus Dormibacteria bacterium]
MNPNLSGLGRFADSALFVLASLGGGPKHGYAIMRDVRRDAGVQLGPGTLYGAISRLERRGWIVAQAAESRRRPYALTDVGRRVLLEECSQLRHFVDRVLVQQPGS